ncbi:unnamed protein product [Cunninghamella echinulata]
MASWVISFGGLCGGRSYGSAWWIIIFELLLIGGIIFLILTDLFYQHRFVVLAFLAVSVSYITDQLGVFTSTYIHNDYFGAGAAGAVIAGYIILVIIQIAWIFVFGSDPNTYLGEFAKHSHNSVQQQPSSNNHIATSSTSPQQHHQQQPIEMTTEKIAYENNDVQPSPALSHPSAAASPVLEYKERVEALHDYQASPDDPNELSFTRGEVLEIVDRRGNWWQARKSDGTVGIIPSNYFA